MTEIPKNPRWGNENRNKKADAILQTILNFTDLSLKETTWLDIGCGGGKIALHIAPHVKSIMGIDPEPWSQWADFQKTQPNLQLIQASIDQLAIPDNSVDVIICNQVYEHVPDPQLLIAEIHRLLKTGGYCYFAGPNLLFPIEPHVFLPFVHWLPRNVAIKLMSFFGSKGILDAYSENYWTLQTWLADFEIHNAVPYIIKNPAKYDKTSLLWRMLSYLPTAILQNLTWLSPGFVFVLKKN